MCYRWQTTKTGILQESLGSTMCRYGRRPGWLLESMRAMMGQFFGVGCRVQGAGRGNAR